jgi:competence protein ComEC
VRFQISFLSYFDFKYHKFLNLDAKVINQYKKKNYYVLKLKTKTLTFYTTSRENLKNLLNENINLTIITKNVSFFDYLFTFYAPSFNLKLKPITKVEELIEKQHKSEVMKNFYKALFLGEALSFDTRQKLSTLGVSHLVALSGLHLGFISFLLYFLFNPLYSFFQQRFFPYRNRFVDLAIVVFVIEFLYLHITSYPPSLIRAFILEIVVFLYAYYLQNPFSLKVLVFVFLFSFLIFWMKVFSVGYFLSIAGVFYIYLFFRYFKPTIKGALILNFYMFCVMFVISHTFFGNFNIYQLFSPFVNILFSIFYPLEAFLHIIGLGGVFDSVILKYLSLGGDFVEFRVPFFVMVLFIALSIGAFFKKWLFYGINLLSIIIIGVAIGI